MSAVEEYLTTLTTALHGPSRAEKRMLAEIRDGLEDTVAAHRSGGIVDQLAVDRAMREFGTIDELAASCQPELTIAQARHTARAVALTVLLLIACWCVAHPHAADIFAVHLAGFFVAATLPALVTVATTGTLERWLPVPRLLPSVIAWTGTATGVVMAVATPALAVVAVPAANWPLLAVSGTLAAAHAIVATSARACRRCARLA